MNAFINYLLEANLGLVLFLLLYWILLRGETDFSLNRAFLLMSIAVSLVFPLFHFTSQTQLVPTISALVPSTWLPEVVVYADGNPAAEEAQVTFDPWMLTRLAYIAGLFIAFLVLLYRLIVLFKLIRTAQTYPMDKFTILESNKGEQSSFSFFNYIFIGKSAALSQHEKEVIIDHERIHAQRLHSFDILLVNVLGILFWFNPVIRIYKKIFVHVHEYEADARAVKAHDVNDYCSLLAKVALLSADIRLASHFSNSLTVKRIEMIRKFKSKIKQWKVAALFGAIPLFFFVVSCQDQLVDDITELARNSSVAMDAPPAIVERFEAVKKVHPNSTYILVEFNEEGDRLLAKMEKAHGIPSSIELFTPDHGLYKNSTLNTEPEKISFNQSQEWELASTEMNGLRTFAIIEYNTMAKKIAERSKDASDVFTIVDQTAKPSDGMAAFYEHVGIKLNYPAEARRMGIEGKVFVEFVVQTDGSLTDVKVTKGIGAGCDEMAETVVRTSPIKWIPGKNDGTPVKQRIVLPVTFRLASKEIVLKDETATPENSINEVVVVGYKEN
ncbi:MAG TPA: M56 family metallopeptidase [Chryseolinea sp.]|nr:M56 family metallopeptidase [Chryseolinea sp.]